jgi:hypothetical protein
VPGLYPEENFLVTTFIRSATPTYFIAGPLAASMTGFHQIKITMIIAFDEQKKNNNQI